VLERVREQLEADDQADELEERLSNLQKRLASKQAERDRAMRLYIRGLISEEVWLVYEAPRSSVHDPKFPRSRFRTRGSLSSEVEGTC
jgi:hypothetical protein